MDGCVVTEGLELSLDSDELLQHIEKQEFHGVNMKDRNQPGPHERLDQMKMENQFSSARW